MRNDLERESVGNDNESPFFLYRKFVHKVVRSKIEVFAEDWVFPQSVAMETNLLNFRAGSGDTTLF